MKVFVLALCCFAGAVPEAPVPPDDALRSLKLTITSSSAQYVLGEPIVIRGALRNIGKERIQEVRVDRPPGLDSLHILVSADGAEFNLLPTELGFPTVRYPRATLRPGEEWTFEKRVLCNCEGPLRLAFERPGKYFLRLGYPLFTRSRDRPEVVYSNTLPVEVKTPEGVDARVWNEVKSPEFLYFLQTGVPETRENLPRKGVELLKTIPNSRYHPALRFALEKYYHVRSLQLRTVDAVARDPEMSAIRGVLGMPEPKPPQGPFLEDRRLDVKLTYEFAVQTPYEDVFELIWQLSGVRLRVAPELRIRRLEGRGTDQPLREFMRIMNGSDQTWVRERDGSYRLVPTEKFKPPDPFRAKQKNN